jgi:hypothetical protein
MFACTTIKAAIIFANAVGAGLVDEQAADLAGKMAKAPVCGVYGGPYHEKSWHSEWTTGQGYHLTEYQFEGRGSPVVWVASQLFRADEASERYFNKKDAPDL